MEEIIDFIFSFPGTILIRDEYQDGENFDLQFGIQNKKCSKRFANILGPKSKPHIYFKHNMDEIEGLYTEYNNIIIPSDVATKYWSKITSIETIELSLVKKLISSSRDMILEKYSKKAKEDIIRINGDNQFKLFHQICNKLANEDSIYYKCTDYEEPTLSYDLNKFAMFSFNRLYLVFNAPTVEMLNVDYVTVEKLPEKVLIALPSEESTNWNMAIEKCQQTYL